MTYTYSDPSREHDEHALPDVEIFQLTVDHLIEAEGITGWFYCLPNDPTPFGPFDSYTEAKADAQENDNTY